MERPTQRHEALRQRVVAGRERHTAKQRRASAARKGGRRVIAIGAGLAMVAGVLTVTQLASSALEDNQSGLGAGDCQQVVEEVSTNEMQVHEEVGDDGTVHRHYYAPEGGWANDDQDTNNDGCVDGTGDGDGDGDGAGGGQDGDGSDGGDGTGDGGDGDGGDGTGDGGDGSGGDGTGDGGDGSGDGDGGDGTVDPDDPNGLDPLGRSCDDSNLPPHDGFQNEAATCVTIAMGEAPAFENNPSLLITDNPEWVQTDEPFTFTVSTRNLTRDRFLGAAAGGYYYESSFLDEQGNVRGHFHAACTPLVDGNVAPSPDALANPGFFVAVEDGGGGSGVSEVTIEVPGLAEPGMYRCMAWAGDASHRSPMLTFARMQIAVDIFRLSVTEDGAPPEGEG